MDPQDPQIHITAPKTEGIDSHMAVFQSKTPLVRLIHLLFVLSTGGVYGQVYKVYCAGPPPSPPSSAAIMTGESGRLPIPAGGMSVLLFSTNI